MRCRALDPYGRVVLKRRRKIEGGLQVYFLFVYVGYTLWTVLLGNWAFALLAQVGKFGD